jgi:predicted PhzF superfamily epimerase YddE/YHI9
MYACRIVDVFKPDALRGNQLAILPDAAGISTEGLQSRIQFW